MGRYTLRVLGLTLLELDVPDCECADNPSDDDQPTNDGYVSLDAAVSTAVADTFGFGGPYTPYFDED